MPKLNRRSMAKERICADGLAIPRPAMSGAEPWIGSYSAGRRPDASGAPSVADGSMPSDPVSAAARSESTSPNRFDARITSNCLGREQSCMAALSAYMCSSSTSANSALWTSPTTARHRRPDCITFAFSHDVTLLRRLRARSKATRATRAISSSEYTSVSTPTRRPFASMRTPRGSPK